MAVLITIGIVYSALMYYLCRWSSRQPRTPVHAIGVALVLTALSFLLTIPVLVVQGIGVIVLIMICSAADISSKSFMRGVLGMIVVSFAFGGWIGIETLRDVWAMRQKYPLQSISNRLEYETPVAAHPEPAISEVVAMRLERFNDAPRPRHRSKPDALERLHSAAAAEFAVTAGFGADRMIGMNLHFMTPRETEKAELSCLVDLQKGTPIKAGKSSEIDPSRDDLLGMHDAGQQDFLNPDTFGYVRDRDHVAGFESHHFSKLPVSEGEHSPFQNWKIVKLKLVSILKHETPVAYVSESLPNLEELDKFPTRPLDEFETAALVKLQSKEDLIVDEQPARIRMLGSLRAGKTCLQCHTVNRGTLLGAFTYDLQPATAN